MLRAANVSSQRVLDKIANAPRVKQVKYYWTSGWNETTARQDGFFVFAPAVPEAFEDIILQGPHFTVANPYARQPNANSKNRQDTSAWNLELLPESPIARSNYQRAKSVHEFDSAFPKWEGRSARQFWRLAWRRMVDPSTVRSLHAALIPPGPTHVDLVQTIAFTTSYDLVTAGGMWASLPVDFLVKVSGVTKVQAELAGRFPHPRDHPLLHELWLRTLRLNCLTAHYADLWQELFDERWHRDSWTQEIPAMPIGEVERDWSTATPLRKDLERRQALVEIDAIAAVMLGITAEELCSIYRTQFGVLRKYERSMKFDRDGRQVKKEVLRETPAKGARFALDTHELPTIAIDREADMTIAHKEFSRRAERNAS